MNKASIHLGGWVGCSEKGTPSGGVSVWRQGWASGGCRPRSGGWAVGLPWVEGQSLSPWGIEPKVASWGARGPGREGIAGVVHLPGLPGSALSLNALEAEEKAGLGLHPCSSSSCGEWVVGGELDAAQSGQQGAAGSGARFAGCMREGGDRGCRPHTRCRGAQRWGGRRRATCSPGPWTGQPLLPPTLGSEHHFLPRAGGVVIEPRLCSR